MKKINKNQFIATAKMELQKIQQINEPTLVKKVLLKHKNKKL